MPRFAPVPRFIAGGYVIPAALVLLGGCAGGSAPTAPTATSTPQTPASAIEFSGGAAASPDGEVHFIPGGYQLSVTREPLAAEITPWRSGAGIQGKLFDLDIDNFMKSDTLTLDGLRLDPDGNVIVDYTVNHPFVPPTNLDGPATAANRADLGFTGRVLFLGDVSAAEVSSHTFFTDVVANTELVLNADHYVTPGALLVAGDGLRANTFPGKLIVDEDLGTNGNRNGIPNGGDPRGNYDAPSGGWQRGNIGASRNGWTGYDFLHQGQSASNSATFDRDALEAGRASLAVAILIKYTDPRGVPFPQNRNVRLPQSPTDASVFAYRLPNGALDASKIEFEGADIVNGQINLTTEVGSEADFSIMVRDWDARATETTEAELDDDSDLSHINIDTSGAPVVTLDFPALVATEISFTSGAQTGLPGNEIAYSGTVSNNLGTALAGTRPAGLVRVEDPENTAAGRPTFHFGVDPDTLQASPDEAMAVITYQALHAQVDRANTAPDCGDIALSATDVQSGNGFTVDLTTVSDDDLDPISFTFEYSGPTQSSSSTVVFLDLAGESAFDPFSDSRLISKLALPTTPGAYELAVTLDDSFADPTVCRLPFTVSPNAAPDCGDAAINEPGPFGNPVAFTLDLSTISDDAINNLDLTFAYSGPGADTSSALSISSADLGAETAFDPFADPRLVVPLSSPTIPGDYDLVVTIDDGVNSTACRALPFSVNGAPGCGSVGINDPSEFPLGQGFTVDLSSAVDPEGDPVGVSFNYVGAGTSQSGEVQLVLADEDLFDPFNDPRLADKLDLPPASGFYQLFISFNDGLNTTVCGPFDFRAVGTTAPPDCGTGIVLSKSGFRVGQEVDFTVDLVAVSDPDMDLLSVGYYLTGPVSNDATSQELMAQPLPSASSPWDDFRRNLEKPTAAGIYTIEAFVADQDGTAICIGSFSIVP